MKNIFVCAWLLLAATGPVLAQDHFTIEPKYPRPGDLIRFRYQPPPEIFNSKDLVECRAYTWGNYIGETALPLIRQCRVADILLKKEGNVYTGVLQTDSLAWFSSFTFSSGDPRWAREGSTFKLQQGKLDSNHSRGYFTMFYVDSTKPVRLSAYYAGSYLQSQFGNDMYMSNPAAAHGYYDMELKNYPVSKHVAYSQWLTTAPRAESAQTMAAAGKEAERIFAEGVANDGDAFLLQLISLLQGKKEQSAFFTQYARDKFGKGNGMYGYLARVNKFRSETDPVAKKALLDEITELHPKMDLNARIRVGNTSPASLSRDYAEFLFFTRGPAASKDYMISSGIQPAASPYEYKVFSKIMDTALARKQYLQEAEAIAEEYAQYYTVAANSAAKSKKLPGGGRAGLYLSADDKMDELNKAAAVFGSRAARFAHTRGDSRKAWQHAQASRKHLQQVRGDFDEVPVINEWYCRIAEKVLPAERAWKEVETVLAKGTVTPALVDQARSMWVAKNGSDEGFNAYKAQLRKESTKNLDASKLNIPMPAFSLRDLNGNPVRSEDLKGKTVVYDFWATWCLPCIASFPGMQKMVDHYKSNPNVKFVFVNTMEVFEKEEDRLAAVKKFFSNKPYKFDVLLDDGRKLAQQFKVEAIPAKFMVDKNGVIRYKVVGAEPDQNKLFDEMTSMIESMQ